MSRLFVNLPVMYPVSLSEIYCIKQIMSRCQHRDIQVIVFSELSEMRTVMCFGIDFSPHICIVEELVMTLLIIVKFGKWEKPDGVRFADPLHNKGVSNESCGVCAENVYGRV